MFGIGQYRDMFNQVPALPSCGGCNGNRQGSFVWQFPGHYRGEFVKTIYVETDIPEQRFVRLELRGEAQSLIDEIKPASPFYAGKLKADHEYQFQFELLPTRDNIELSVTADSNCRLMRHGSKWIAICTLTPKA